jgi:hypothetical protein
MNIIIPITCFRCESMNTSRWYIITEEIQDDFQLFPDFDGVKLCKACYNIFDGWRIQVGRPFFLNIPPFEIIVKFKRKLNRFLINHDSPNQFSRSPPFFCHFIPKSIKQIG